MLWTIIACGTPPLPPGLPNDTLPLRVADGDLVFGADAKVVEPWEVFAADPTEPVDPGLLAGFQGSAGRPLWVELPPETPFWAVRRVLGTAKEAEITSIWLSAAGSPELFPVTPAPRFTIGGACAEPIAVTGAAPLITVSLQRGADGAWVVATARFIPITADGPTEVLSNDCLAAPSCDTLFTDPKLLEACNSGVPGAPERVTLAGERGCLLPIARTPDMVAAWRPELARVIGVLGLGDHPLRVVMPEARTRLDAVFAVLGGFVDAGLPVPNVGATLLVEGNDGPPVCNATVRDKQQLAEAGARWLGSLRWKKETEDGG